MSSQFISVSDDETVLDTIRLMCAEGVRRMPVINQEGGLEGIITTDDILDILAEETAELAKIPQHGKNIKARTRR